MRSFAWLQRVLLALVALTSCVSADADERQRYLRHIKPLLKERCWACHGALKQEAELRLDTGKLIRQGTPLGTVVDPADVDGSPLIERISSTDPDLRMPPIGEPLSPDEIEAVRAWIAGGAISPADEQPEPDPNEHWAFQPIERPATPEAGDDDAIENPIDSLLQASWNRHGLQPVAPAAPAELLRRVYLDLIGLPPTPEQVEAFVKDPSDQAWRDTIDRLLDSPLYGQRWGRHWMDVWRYSDWYGRRQQNDVRNSAPQIWRWRDWIVDSLNEDKSYARMIEEMLAADELAADDDTAWPATGYLIRNYYSLNPNEWMRHNVEYTAKAFLGLTFNCAHCHDHKYDPISQDDYFRLRAFFEPLGVRQDRVLGEPEPPPFEPYIYAGSRKVVRLGMVRTFDEKPDAPTWFYTGGDERNRVEDRGSIAPGVPAFLGVPFPEIDEVELPMQGWYPGSRPPIQHAVLSECQEAIKAAEEAVSRIAVTEVDDTRLQQEHEAAQRALDQALATAAAKGETTALSGKQSLLLDAADGGRQVLQTDLTQLEAIPESTLISFRIKVLKEGHVNFQLARDSTKLLTALFVGFVDGKIKAYRPGGFTEFVVGNYDFAGGQNDFVVQIKIKLKDDVGLLSVRPRGAASNLVTDVPIALNGWNTVTNPHQPMTWDCRSGTRAVLDDVSLIAGDQRLYWDFEPPKFVDGGSIDGIDGWGINPLTASPARAEVSSYAACESVWDERDAVRQAELALQDVHIELDAAEQQLRAARLKQQSVEATVAADNAQRSGVDLAEQQTLAIVARKAQRTANEADAQYRVLRARSNRKSAQQLPDDDNGKAGKLKQAETELAAAEKNLQQLLASKHDPSDQPVYQRLSPTSSPSSTGRRAALARWITHPDNPLTPRVAVNHIWMRHFHAPLVESVDDFGRNGKPPVHPEVLEWLAAEFLQSGWSIKHLHRQILGSQAYRMTTSDSDAESSRTLDEDNRLLWRMNSGRMEAEVVRDSILFIAGKLDTSTGGQPLSNTDAPTTFRRGLYYETFPEDGGSSQFAELFDPPDPTECFRRTATIIPQQALAMSNSEIVHAACGDVVRRIGVDQPDNEFIRAAFLSILSRLPEEDERRLALQFVSNSSGDDDQTSRRASLVRVLFNHNDFLTIR